MITFVGLKNGKILEKEQIGCYQAYRWGSLSEGRQVVVVIKEQLVV